MYIECIPYLWIEYLGQEIMVRKILHILVLTVAFPCLISFIVYFGFGSNYTKRVFHQSGFLTQYESGIYKYRILGRYLLLETHRFLTADNSFAQRLSGVCSPPPASAGVLDDNTDPVFYAAYFVQNTIFMVFSCIILYLILVKDAATAFVSTTVMVASLLIGVSQYVVCPYDTLSYALLLLSFLLITRPFRFSYTILVLVLITGTLTRESAALTLSFFFAHHYTRLISKNSKELRQLAFLIAVFIATYGMLRVFLGFDRAIWENVHLVYNLTLFRSWIGIIAMLIVSYLITAISPDKKKCLTFLAASSPYWLGMLVIADVWEIRLWVPVWLGLLCITRENPINPLQRKSMR